MTMTISSIRINEIYLFCPMFVLLISLSITRCIIIPNILQCSARASCPELLPHILDEADTSYDSFEEAV